MRSKFVSVKLTNNGIKTLCLVAVASLLFFADCAFADAGKGSVGDLASNVLDSMSNLAKLITAGSYVAGFGFAMGAILKFKAHKDNPQQIPIGTPIALLFIGAALIFIPAIFGTAGMTIFKSTTNTGGVSGVSSFS